MANQTDVNQYVVSNPGVLATHSNWHMLGRTFPLGVPGSGDEFLQFHRSLLNPFRTWLANNGHSSLTSWIASLTQIPNNPGLRATYTNDRQVLTGTRSQLQATFATRDALGVFIEGRIHGIVHSAFASVSNGGNGIDPRFADPMRAPESIRFWRWHAWIDRVWTRSGL